MLIACGVVILVAAFVIYHYQHESVQPAPVFTSLMPPTPVPTLSMPTYVPVTPAVSLAQLHWVSYTSKYLGVTFRYPDNYATIQENQNTTFLISGLSYVFSVNRIETSLSPAAWWDSGANERKKNGAPADQYILSNVTFKDMPAVYFKNNFMAQVPMDFYAIPRNGYILTINFETEGTEAIQVGPSPNATEIQFYEGSTKSFEAYDKIIIQKILDSIVLN